MKVYLSGWQGGILPREKRLLKAGITHRCFSFINVELVSEIKSYYIKRIVTGFEYAVKNAGIMMDSSVYSMRRYMMRIAKQGGNFDILRNKYMRQYAEYCRANAHRFDFYMTCDFQPDAPEIYKAQVKLEAMGIRPVPVFHGDASIDYLKRYCDRGHTLVGVGAGAYIADKRRHLDAIFDFGAKHGVRFHGLAITAPWALMQYDFSSVDSSSWSRVAAVGGIMRFNPVTCRMEVIHVSDQEIKQGRRSVQMMPRDVLRRFTREIAAEGFDLHELGTDFTLRHIYNAKSMLCLAQAADKKHGATAGGFRKLL